VLTDTVMRDLGAKRSLAAAALRAIR